MKVIPIKGERDLKSKQNLMPEQSECVFCNIANKVIVSDLLYEDEAVFAIKDIAPKAPVHLLVLPKKHIVSVNDLQTEHQELIGSLMLVAKQLAKQHGVASSGYKLVVNVGEDGGQVVPHLHMHVLGGKKLGE